jgi:nitroreductase
MKRYDTDIHRDVKVELRRDPSIDDAVAAGLDDTWLWTCRKSTGDALVLETRTLPMDLEEAIVGRRSVRSFTRTPVDPVLIEELIHTAVRAPSAMNRQPWVFTVLRNQGDLHHVSCEAKRHLLTSAEPGKESDQLHAMLNDANFDIFYGAPALIVISAREAAPCAVEDCALAAQNLMLKAHAIALGTCWIGFAQSYLNTPQGKDILKLSGSCVVIAPIVVGHPKLATLPVPRNAPEIHWLD